MKRNALHNTIEKLVCAGCGKEIPPTVYMNAVKVSSDVELPKPGDWVAFEGFDAIDPAAEKDSLVLSAEKGKPGTIYDGRHLIPYWPRGRYGATRAEGLDCIPTAVPSGSRRLLTKPGTGSRANESRGLGRT